jgi:hypothetical protein
MRCIDCQMSFKAPVQLYLSQSVIPNIVRTIPQLRMIGGSACNETSRKQ